MLKKPRIYCNERKFLNIQVPCTKEGERKGKGTLEDLMSYCHLEQSFKVPALLSLKAALNSPNTPKIITSTSSKAIREGGN